MSTERPNLLFVTKSDLSGKDGHNIITRNIALAFSRSAAVETTVVCPEPAGLYPPEFEDSVRSLRHFSQGSSNPSIAERIWSEVDMARLLRRIVVDDETDAIVARHAPEMLAPALVAKQFGIPYGLLARGTSHRRLRFSWLLTRLFQFNVRAASRVYAASADIAAEANEARRPGQEPAKVLANAVDTREFQPEPKYQARGSIGLELDPEFVVGFVGSMKPYHRVEVLIRALDRLEVPGGVGVLLVGDGPELERYRSIAEEVGVSDAVAFAGFVPQKNVPIYVSACDVLYSVRSHTSATPVKVFEYLACERPVIIRQMAELEFVTELDIGKTVPKPDPEEVAEAIEALYGLDTEERRSMGKRGRKYVLENHTWQALTEQILEDLD